MIGLLSSVRIPWPVSAVRYVLEHVACFGKVVHGVVCILLFGICSIAFC